MYQQPRICETLSTEAGIARINALIEANASASRTQIGREVCRAFGFRDARGRLQQASGMKVLRALDACGRIALAAPRNRGGQGTLRRLDQAVPAAVGVPERVDHLDHLELVLVTTDRERRQWTELIAREHPRGAVRQVGAQLRYLVVSEHGHLGALGFSASALALAARDRWIGWEATLRRQQLHRVVALSRFLIRPGIDCRNLASKVLGRCLKRLPRDFEARYGYRPVLVETFVDGSRHTGASLRAANWTYVGETTGRGRFAPPGTQVAVKSIYGYPLVRDWRAQLGVVLPGPLRALAPGDGLDRAVWAQNEFGDAPLGDVRLSRRLVQSAAVQGEHPQSSFPAAAQSDKAMVMGHYRMIDQPADCEVTPVNILAPHRQRTLQRMQGQSVVLCLQDGTDLNFAEHPGCAGLGLIGKNRGSSGTLGLHLHSMLVVNGEGIPLGVPQIQYEAPDGNAQKNPPPEARKTQRWVRGLQETARLADELDGVRPIAVMDREADIFDLFVEQRRLGNLDLLVRAKHDRRLGKGEPSWFADLRRSASRASLEIPVPRSSARRGTGKQPAKANRAARLAAVALRWKTVSLPAPKESPFTKEAPVSLNLVHLCEEAAPEGVVPLEWFLWTTVPVTSAPEAIQVIEWYRLRWRIEDWHRVLKSGCKVEFLGHRRGERIERAVTIKAVIAWRLMAMTLLGRKTPELPVEVLFSDLEIAALEDFARDRQFPAPDNLGRAVLTMARMGGYLNRKHDPPPGHQKIWEGYTVLAITAQTYERLGRLGLYQQLRPDKTCV